MISKIDFIRKIKKNRFLVLVISVIVLSCLYFGVQKAIDAYVFNNNNDIVGENGIEEDGGHDGEVVSDGEIDEVEEKNWFERLFGSDEDEVVEEEADAFVESEEASSAAGEGKISEDEVNFEIDSKDEGSEGGTENGVADGLENDSR